MQVKKSPGVVSTEVHVRRMHLEEKLIENLVELQKVHTQLAERFDKLSDQMSSLLSLFEGAAQSFARNPVNQVSDKDQEFLEKIDRLLEQNKTIARGLTLMEERIRDKVTQSVSQPASQSSPFAKADENDQEPDAPPIANRPLPRF